MMGSLYSYHLVLKLALLLLLSVICCGRCQV
uniref:Uncharacterized protein n=1 Tax=Rhizophora mucronata TaxID=61149 RepID=A0A2P2NJ65_RHIMU